MFSALFRTFSLCVALYSFSVSAQSYEFQIVLDQGPQSKKNVKMPFLKNKVVSSFEGISNNGVSSDELQYLLGIVIGKEITEEEIYRGLERLNQKNVFAKLSLKYVVSDDQVAITLQTEAFWIIRSIKVEGVSLAKESIVQSYQLRIGEKFILKKHELSLQEICKDLHKKGYWDAQATAFFDYNLSKKAVDITLLVQKGRLYFIDDAMVIINSGQHNKEKNELHALLYKRIVRHLLYQPYSEKLLNTKLKMLELMIFKEGFIYVKINSDLQKNYKKKTVFLTVTVHLEHAKKTVFLGNRFFPSSLLLDTVVQCGNAIGVVPPIILAEEIMELYRSKGFWNTTINNDDDGLYHYFVINEGRRNSITNVVIEGPAIISESFIKKKFFKHFHNFEIDEKKLDTAIRNCLNWYKSEGFWDVQCLKKEYVPTDKDGCYQLVLVIEEGKQRIIKDTVVEGMDFFKKNELFIISSAKKNISLSEDLLEKQKDYIQKECKKQGYVHAVINYHLEEVDYQYRVVWRVDLGRKMVFGKTIIKGSSVVDHKKILHFLTYQEGAVWNRDALNTLFLKLHDLDVYKSIGIQQHFNHLDNDICDVIIALEDDDPCEVKLRFGYQQVSKNFALKRGSSYKIGGSFMYKNPTNRADAFVIDAEITRFERRFSTAYKQPVVLSLPINMVIKGYSNAYMNPVSIGSRKVLYEALQEGMLVGISSKGEFIDIGLSSGIEWSKITDISKELAALLLFVPQLVNERVPYCYFEPTFYINHLDNNVDPHDGYYLFTSVKTLIPFDPRVTASIKCIFEHGIYGNYRSIVGAARIKLGYILLQDFFSIMPPYRFYLGGSNSLRGYQPDKCPPLATYIDDEGQRQWAPQGGKSMLNINLEARFPLPLAQLHGAVFQDFGILASTIKSFIHTPDPLAATGFGLRYLTPLGPLRFDIGWKWYKHYEEDSSYAWFLTFGYAF